MAVPMWVGDNLMGVFEMGSYNEFAFNEADMRFLQTLAAHAGLSTQSGRVVGILTEILSSKSIRKLVNTAVTKLPELVNARACSLFLRKEPNTENAYLVATRGLPQDKVLEDLSFPQDSLTRAANYAPGVGLTGWVLKEGLPLNIEGHSSEVHRKVDLERRSKTYGISKIEWAHLYIENETEKWSNHLLPQLMQRIHIPKDIRKTSVKLPWQ